LDTHEASAIQSGFTGGYTWNEEKMELVRG
jgi:hypothetical protein